MASTVQRITNRPTGIGVKDFDLSGSFTSPRVTTGTISGTTSGTTSGTMTGTRAPVYNQYGYETQESINNRYADMYSQYANDQNKIANQQTEATNKQYDNAQNQNYVQYMMNQKNIPGQLARLGITGGASESSQLRANTNYENMRNATENERGQALGNIKNTLANSLSEYQQQSNAQKNAALAESAAKTAAAKQAEKERQEKKKEEKALRDRESYEKTIRRYDTIKKVDKAIAAAKKAGAPKWKIRLLQAQRADLVAAQKEEEKANGKSGGGGSRGGGRGGSRGGSRGGNGKSKANNSKKPKSKGKSIAANRAMGYVTKGVGKYFSNLNKYL